MVYQMNQVNDAIRSRPTAFVAECDRALERQLQSVAEKISAHRQTSHIVLLAGPSGSGKTTTAKKLAETLEGIGVGARVIGMDNYFHTVRPETAPRTPEGDIDHESPLCLDMELLREHFRLLDEGQEIQVPRFDFAHQRRAEDGATSLRLGENEVAIFEGIHALNDAMTQTYSGALGIYVSAQSHFAGDGWELTSSSLRLARRAVRDAKFRGWNTEVTVKMWHNICRGEAQYIAPFSGRAEIQIDTTLPYEVGVLKPFVREYLEKEESVRENPYVQTLLTGFAMAEELPLPLLAPNSLLREFVGGGIYRDV